MKVKCPNCNASRPNISKFGSFRRKSDSKTIQRFRCKLCMKSFSNATFSDCYNQNKRRLNHSIRMALCSAVSMRRVALALNISRTTVKRKLVFLGESAIRNQEDFLKTRTFKNVQFDDLETFEHTKLKPLTVTVAVEKKTRKIIGLKVSPIGAKGLIAKKSLRLYGKRKNESHKSRELLFEELKKVVDKNAVFESDEHKHYPVLLRKHFPEAKYLRFKSTKGALVGQGELKRVSYDPLFSINHTLAMLRANINRLVRRTWCTTKRARYLELHLWMYADFHNSVLT